MEKLFENILKMFPEGHRMIMPLRRSRSGMRYTIFLLNKFRSEETEYYSKFKLTSEVEDMMFSLISTLEGINRNTSLKNINAINNVWEAELKSFMSKVKVFIDKNKDRKSFVSYNNYLRIKKIERLKHE